MSFLSRWSVIGVAALSASCASPYGPSFLTGGYSDTRIDDTHYQVKFDGNGNSSKERVWSFWFYRCAELTKQKGYTYFALQKAAPKASAAPTFNPYRLADYRAADAPRMIPVGTVYVPIYVPGQTITTWHTNAIIALLNDPLPERTGVFRAQSILDDLGPYIQSDGKTTPVARDDVMKHAFVFRAPLPVATPNGNL